MKTHKLMIVLAILIVSCLRASAALTTLAITGPGSITHGNTIVCVLGEQEGQFVLYDGTSIGGIDTFFGTQDLTTSFGITFTPSDGVLSQGTYLTSGSMGNSFSFYAKTGWSNASAIIKIAHILFDGDGQLVSLAADFLYKNNAAPVDPVTMMPSQYVTGALRINDDTPYSLSDITSTLSSVPEPSTPLTALLSGGLVAFRRRR